MIMILLSFCFLFAKPKSRSHTIIDNELLVFSDLKKENLECGYFSNKEGTKGFLKDVTDLYNPEKAILGVNVFSLKLPDTNAGMFYLKVLDDEENRLFVYSTTFRRETFLPTKYHLEVSRKLGRRDDKDYFPYEANYKYLSFEAGDKTVLTISDNIDNKVKLDLRLGSFQFRYVEEVKERCELLLKDTRSILQFLKADENPLGKDIADIENLLLRIVLPLTQLYFSAATYKNFYKSLEYKNTKVEFPFFVLTNHFYLPTLKVLAEDDKSLSGEVFEEMLLNENFSEEMETSISKVRKDLDESRVMIVKMNEYITKWNKNEKKYSNSLMKKYLGIPKDKKDVDTPQVKKLKGNMDHIATYLSFRVIGEILNFSNQFVKNSLEKEKIEEVGNEIKEATNIFDSFLRVGINMAGLYLDNYEEFLNNLSNDTIFNELSPDVIVKSLNDLKKKIDDLKESELNDFNFRLLGKNLDLITSKIETELKFWQDVKSNNTDVGFFELKPNNVKDDNKDDENKKTNTSKKDDNNSKHKKMLIFSITIVAVIILIFIIRMIKK